MDDANTKYNMENAKSILRKQKYVNSMFVSAYGMNLYRGCVHACSYCDGMAEKYYAPENFDSEISVKANATELLQREMDPARRRKPMKKAFFIIGGGVSDAYQPAETDFKSARSALSTALDFGHPVHILTKSNLAARDIDLILKINKRSKAIVSMSFSTVDDKTAAVFEAGAPPPSERLQALKQFTDEGVCTGAFLMPLIPFVTDIPELIDESFAKFKEQGLSYAVCAGLTLRPGRQKDIFMRSLLKKYPKLELEYANIYKDENEYGEMSYEYFRYQNELILQHARKYEMPLRIPSHVYRDILSENDFCAVELSNIDYALQLMGRRSPFKKAIWSLLKLEQPVSSLKSLRELHGAGGLVSKVLCELIDKRTNSYYHSLLGY